MKHGYTLLLFIGSSGILFYAHTIFPSFLPDTTFVILMRLLIFLVSVFILHRGYKILEEEKSIKVKWSVSLALLLIGIISVSANHFFGFAWGFSLAIGLNILLMMIVRRMA